MTHPNQSLAELACPVLLRIQGVFAVCARGIAENFTSPEEIRTEAELAATSSGVDFSNRQQFIDAYFEDKHKQMAKDLGEGQSPFPHVTKGRPEILHYLRGLTDLLGPGYDDRIDSKIGEVRFVAETWSQLIVGVAIQVRDPGSKSLPRGLRRARKKVEGS